jgi:two-component system, NarL family, nitrate/nitrite response regulator NarL
MSIRIVLADDHPVFRDSLSALLRTDPAFDVIGEASDARTAVTAVVSLRPDVLLVDLSMPEASGLETLRLLMGESVSTRSIVLTAAIQRMEAVQAVQWGARGVVLKAEASSLLFQAIRAVADDQFWIGAQKLPDQDTALRRALEGPSVDPFNLSPREREIVAALAEGLANRDVAKRLGVTEATIKHHLKNIFDKCGVSSRLELVLFAVSHGLARL